MNIFENMLDNIEVNIIDYMNETDTKYSKQEVLYNGKMCLPRMINNICNFTPRTELIIREIIRLGDEGRKILVFSDRREHLKNIKTMLDGKLGRLAIGAKSKDAKQFKLNLYSINHLD